MNLKECPICNKDTLRATTLIFPDVKWKFKRRYCNATVKCLDCGFNVNVKGNGVRKTKVNVVKEWNKKCVEARKNIGENGMPEGTKNE